MQCCVTYCDWVRLIQWSSVISIMIILLVIAITLSLCSPDDDLHIHAWVFVELLPMTQTPVIISVYVVPMHPRVVIKWGFRTVAVDNYFMPHNILVPPYPSYIIPIALPYSTPLADIIL